MQILLRVSRQTSALTARLFQPRDATKEELRLLHTVNQIEELEQMKLSPEPENLKQFSSRFDAVFVNENTYDVTVRAAGCAIELTDQVLWRNRALIERRGREYGALCHSSTYWV